jgi:ribosomal protein L21E
MDMGYEIKSQTAQISARKNQEKIKKLDDEISTPRPQFKIGDNVRAASWEAVKDAQPDIYNLDMEQYSGKVGKVEDIYPDGCRVQFGTGECDWFYKNSLLSLANSEERPVQSPCNGQVEDKINRDIQKIIYWFTGRPDFHVKELASKIIDYTKSGKMPNF